jgi:hypothetical protein
MADVLTHVSPASLLADPHLTTISPLSRFVVNSTWSNDSELQQILYHLTDARNTPQPVRLNVQVLARYGRDGQLGRSPSLQPYPYGSLT